MNTHQELQNKARSFWSWFKSDLHWVFVMIPAMILFAIVYFLTDRSDGVTGGEVIGMQSAWSLILTFILTCIAAIVVVWGVRAYNVSQEIGKLIIAIVIAVVLLAWGYGKFFTDKANGGVTAPRYQPK